MSIAFILYCLWIACAAAIGLAPAERRPQLRFFALIAGFAPVLLAALTVGLVPAAIALCGVVALFPAPFAALARMGYVRARARIARWRETHA